MNKPWRKDYIWKEYHDAGFWTVVGDGSDPFNGKHCTGFTYKVEPEAKNADLKIDIAYRQIARAMGGDYDEHWDKCL